MFGLCAYGFGLYAPTFLEAHKTADKEKMKNKRENYFPAKLFR